MSIRKRLNEKPKRSALSQKKFGKFRSAKKPSQLVYDSGKGAVNDDYWLVIVADVVRYYVSAGEKKRDRLSAAIAQLLTGLRADNVGQIKDALDIIRADCIGLNRVDNEREAFIEAISDDCKHPLTIAERNLIAGYRKATQTDKSLIDRLVQLAEKALEHETESGIVENVIDGE